MGSIEGCPSWAISRPIVDQLGTSWISEARWERMNAPKSRRIVVEMDPRGPKPARKSNSGQGKRRSAERPEEPKRTQPAPASKPRRTKRKKKPAPKKSAPKKKLLPWM